MSVSQHTMAVEKLSGHDPVLLQASLLPETGLTGALPSIDSVHKVKTAAPGLLVALWRLRKKTRGFTHTHIHIIG